jgi:DNA-binding transcriptional LysR family regulator
MKSNKDENNDNTDGVGDGAPARRSELDAARIDLNKLRTFCVIAEEGGVSAAAQKLALTRSAVSHSLAALESSLGLLLFHRVGKKLVITREGTRLRGAYADAQGRIADALADIGDEEIDVRGWVRVGLYPGFSPFRLSDALERFSTEHPRAHCRLVNGSRSDLFSRLLEGRLDFVLSLRPGDRSTARRVRSTRFFEQSLVLVVARSFRKPRAGLAGIASLPIFDYFRTEPLIDRWITHHYGRRQVPRGNVRVYCGGGTDLALELTCRGLGAAVMPLDVVEPYRQRGELRVIRGPKPTLRDSIWLNELERAKTSTARVSATQQAFREVLV